MKKHTILFFLLLISHNVSAGQAMNINAEGTVLVWDNSAASPISIHPEAGSCGIYNNAQMLTKLQTSLSTWEDLAQVDLGFTMVRPTDAGGITVDVNGSNFTDYLAYVNGVNLGDSEDNTKDGINPVLFDDDGAIVDSIYGVGARLYTLGSANPAGFLVHNSNTSLYLGILEAQATFNCYCLDDGTGSPEHSDCLEEDGITPIVFSEEDLNFTMLHEMGHVINLDHTQVNANLATDVDVANDDDIPAMYPEAVNSALQKTPTEDDQVALASLYPKATFFTAGDSSSTYCFVTGALVDRYGEAMRCADVQATALDVSYSVSFTSGAYAPTAADECLSNCGDFRFYLKPSRSYSLRASPINGEFVGASSISPCASEQLVQCTAAILTACDGGAGSDGCVPCVALQSLSTNSAGEILSQKINDECREGATVNLGSIATNSVSQIYAGSASGSSSSSGGCSLQTNSVARVSTQFTRGVALLGVMVLSVVAYFKKRRRGK